MREFKLEFPGTNHGPVIVSEGSSLAEALTVTNSPVLFGCRSGLCGTCLIEVEVAVGQLDDADEDEREALEIYAPGNGKARLACQLKLTACLRIRKLDSL